MLDKDQYNQEEYNDYYRQETEGAEIKNSHQEESSGKGIVVVSTLLLLAVAGYFGFTKFNTLSGINSTKETTKIAESIATTEAKNEVAKEEEITKTEIVKDVPTVQEEQTLDESKPKSDLPTTDTVVTKVASAIESSADTSQKMSPEEIAKVVQLVMSQMNQNDSTPETKIDEEESKSEAETKSEEPIEENTNDKDLLSALSNSMVDTIEESEKKDYSDIEETKNIEIKEGNKTVVDTYNKITIQTTSGSDELSKLSEQISNVIQETKETEKTTVSSSNTYTKSIKKEVAARSNAMRVIIVKEGDTLGKIAKRAYGNSRDYKRIYTANPDLINRADRIYIGQKLRIPE